MKRDYKTIDNIHSWRDFTDFTEQDCEDRYVTTLDRKIKQSKLMINAIEQAMQTASTTMSNMLTGTDILDDNTDALKSKLGCIQNMLSLKQKRSNQLSMLADAEKSITDFKSEVSKIKTILEKIGIRYGAGYTLVKFDQEKYPAILNVVSNHGMTISCKKVFCPILVSEKIKYFFSLILTINTCNPCTDSEERRQKEMLGLLLSRAYSNTFDKMPNVKEIVDRVLKFGLTDFNKALEKNFTAYHSGIEVHHNTSSPLSVIYPNPTKYPVLYKFISNGEFIIKVSMGYTGTYYQKHIPFQRHMGGNQEEVEAGQIYRQELRLILYKIRTKLVNAENESLLHIVGRCFTLNHHTRYTQYKSSKWFSKDHICKLLPSLEKEAKIYLLKNPLDNDPELDIQMDTIQ